MATGLPNAANKSFCILPWLHLAVLPEGTAKLCCVAASPVHAEGVPLSLQDHPLEAVWNSPYMRGVRRDMLAGRRLPDCAACYLQEKDDGESRRIMSNARWAFLLGDLCDALVEESRHQEFAATGLPLYYQLMPGNLCNLKCRMCFPTFSTQIENDPVHRRWVSEGPTDPTVTLDWAQGRAALAPCPAPGVTLEGFHGLEHDPQPFRWVGGNTALTLAVPHGIRPEALRLRLREASARGQGLRVVVNDAVVFEGTVPQSGWSLADGAWEQTFALGPQVHGPTLTIRLQGDTVQAPGDPRDLGVAVKLVELTWTGAAVRQDQPGSRLPVGPWYRDDAWVREVLLQNASQLRALYFTGGEPMIEKQVEHILQHLIDRGEAGHVQLEFNTNCTILREPMLEKLQRFERVDLGLSIDACGAVYEYIRYPSKWATVRRNIERLGALAGERFVLVGCVVVQVYNVLHLVEVLEFFDGLGILFSVEFASMPWFLSVGVLPRRIRTLAAERLRAFAARTSRPRRWHERLLFLAQHLESVKDRCTPEALRTLMLFTNDLDAGRRQNVRAVHGELLQLLEDAGFPWTDERSEAAAA
jgi:glutamate-1-semialdehyde 2,1-aminomutase